MTGKTADTPKVSEGAKALTEKLEECVHGYDYYFNCGEAAHLIDAELRLILDVIENAEMVSYSEAQRVLDALKRWQVKV